MQIQTKLITYDETKLFRLRMTQFSMSRHRRSSAFKKDAFWRDFYYGSAKLVSLLEPITLCSKAPEDKDNVMFICVFSEPSSIWLKRCLLTKLHVSMYSSFTLLYHSLLPHHPCLLELPKETDHTQPWVE